MKRITLLILTSFILFLLISPLTAQYYYISDIGTSTLSFTKKQEIKGSIFLLSKGESNIQFGYSPLNNFVVTYSNSSNQKDFFNKTSNRTKIVSANSKSNSFAIGYFLVLKKEEKKGKFKKKTNLLLFDSFLGYTSTDISNDHLTHSFRTRYHINKYYFDPGLLYYTKFGGLRINLKYSLINFDKITVIGYSTDSYERIRKLFKKKNWYSSVELNFQFLLGIPNAKIFLNVPLITVGSVASLPYKEFRSVKFGATLEFCLSK